MKRALLLALLLASIVAHTQQLPAGATDTTAPPPPDPAYQQAETALETRDYPTALRLLTQLADAHPTDAAIAFDLGYAHDSLQHDTEAETAYRKAIALKPDYAEAHLALGLLLARANHLDDARPELKIAAAAPDSVLRAQADRALAHLDAAAHPVDASAALIEALKLSPETPSDTLLAAQLAEAANDLPAAEQAYRRLLTDDATDADAASGLARVLQHQQRAADAGPVLLAALTRHPDDPALTAQLIAIYTAQDKTADALPLAEKIHAAHPADANLSRLLAHLYDRSGQSAKADALYAALILQSPQDPTLLDDRATALIHLNKPAEAEALLKRAVASPQAFPSQQDFAFAASHLAFAASSNHDPLVVLQALSLRAKVLPQSPSSLYLGATANDALHLTKQAIDLYQQFLAAAGGKFPEEETEARKRLAALQHK